LDAVTVTAPPRRPRAHDDVEALIREARERARRRRTAYAAVVALVALLGLMVSTVLERTAPGNASPADGPSGLAAGKPSSRLAFVSTSRRPTPQAGLGGHNDLSVTDGNASAPRVLTHDALASGLAWSPDGRTVAYVALDAGPGDIYLANADGSGTRRVTHGPVYTFAAGPAWSPDGRAIAFARGDWQRPEVDVVVVHVDGGDHRRVTRAVGVIPPLAWAPGGRIVFATWLGPGTLRVFVIGADGRGRRNLTREWGLDGIPVWSPDGRKIAFVSDRAGKSDLSVMNADGTGRRKLASTADPRSRPAWSPDGREIAFESRHGTRSEIEVVHVDGSMLRTLTRRGREPNWSPDGRIAFRSSRDGNPEIYVMNADGSGQRRVTHTPFLDLFPVWSP